MTKARGRDIEIPNRKNPGMCPWTVIGIERSVGEKSGFCSMFNSKRYCIHKIIHTFNHTCPWPERLLLDTFPEKKVLSTSHPLPLSVHSATASHFVPPKGFPNFQPPTLQCTLSSALSALLSQEMMGSRITIITSDPLQGLPVHFVVTIGETN